MTKVRTVAPRDLYKVLLEVQSEVGQGLLVHEAGRVLYANEACCQLSGYSIEELDALPSILDVVVPDERGLILGRMRRRQRGEKVVEYYESAIVHKSGRRVEVEVAVKPLKAGNGTQYVVLLRDITKRKQAEMALERSEQRFRSLTHNASNVLTLARRRGHRTLPELRRRADTRLSARRVGWQERLRLHTSGRS